MSFVRELRVDDKAVANFFEKIPTEADSANLLSEAPGKEHLVNWSSFTEFDDPNNAAVYDLPFSYLVGQNQLQVHWEYRDSSTVPPTQIGWTRLVNKATYENISTFNESDYCYYEELSSNQVKVFNLDKLFPAPYLDGDPADSGPGVQAGIMFSVPHTSTPGSSQNRVVVDSQGDNVGIELQGNGDGIILRTESGARILVRANEGGLTTRRIG